MMGFVIQYWPQIIFIMVPILGIIGFFGRRFFTSQIKLDRATFINTKLDALHKARALGLGGDELVKLEGHMENLYTRGLVAHGIPMTSALVSNNTEPHNLQLFDVEAPAVEPPDDPRLWSTSAMRLTANGDFAIAEAKMEKAYHQLMLLLSEHEIEPYETAQNAWISYRDAEIELATAQFEGGTMGIQVGTATGTDLMNYRTLDLDQRFRERIRQ